MFGRAKCDHEDIDFKIGLVSFETTNLRHLEVSGICKSCGSPIKFRGLMPTINPDRPSITTDEHTASLPLMFGEEVYDGKR